MMPAQVWAHCIVRQPQCGLRCLTPLFHRPPDATSPHAKTQRRALGSIPDGQRSGRGGATRACDDQPHRPLGQVILAKRHPLAGTRIRHRACGPFGAPTAIPPRGWQALRQRRHRQRSRHLGGFRNTGRPYQEAAQRMTSCARDVWRERPLFPPASRDASETPATVSRQGGNA